VPCSRQPHTVHACTARRCLLLLDARGAARPMHARRPRTDATQADYDESGSGADDWPWDPTTTQSSLGSQQLQQSSVSDASASLASAHRSLAQQQLQSLQRRRSSLGADSTRTGSCTTAPPNLLGSSAHAPAWLLAEQLSKTIAVQRWGEQGGARPSGPLLPLCRPSGPCCPPQPRPSAAGQLASLPRPCLLAHGSCLPAAAGS